MVSEAFAPWPALIGGLVIGLSASLLWWGLGKPAGISGIWGSLLGGDFRPSFVLGLLAGGLAALLVAPEVFAVPAGRSLGQLAVAGLLVGFGTRMGGGCTSGHGVCGLSRRSPRSLTAVLAFMAIGAVTATALGAL